MWTNECLASSLFHTAHIGMPQLHVRTWHHIFTVSYITLPYNYKCTALSSHVVLNSPTQATLAINMIQWAKTKSISILSTYVYNYIRPSMQTCKCWLTMRIGFAVLPMLTSSRWLVSDLLELITPSDHERSFQSVTAIYIFRFRMCVCPRRHSVLARTTSWYQVVPWTMHDHTPMVW